MGLFRSCFSHTSSIIRQRIISPPDEKVVLRLNRGERPELSPTVRRAYRQAFDSNPNLQRYPNYPPFYEALSRYIGFSTDCIVVGAGIEEFIRTLTFLCAEKPDRGVAVLWPTCAMYDIYAQAFGVDLHRIKYSPIGTTHFYTADDLIRRIEKLKLGIVFLPNPGQPVETVFSVKAIEQLAEYCLNKGVLLAVDEAHHGFGAPTAIGLVSQFENLLVMRTFSKYFGAASIRVGFCVGQQQLIKTLHAVRPSGEIAGPSMAIANALLQNDNWLQDEAIATSLGRDWLRVAVNTYGDHRMRAYGNAGFSILLEFFSAVLANRVALELRHRGVYVKYDLPYPVSNCLLLSCGNKELMVRFWEHLRIVMGIVHV